MAARKDHADDVVRKVMERIAGSDGIDRDLCFVCTGGEGGEVRAHRALLARHSVLLAAPQPCCGDTHQVVILAGWSLSAAKAMLRYLYSGRCIVTGEAQMSEVRLLLEGLGVEPAVVVGQLHLAASLQETTREAELEKPEAVVKQEAAEDCVSLAVQRRIEEENTRLSKQVLELMENLHQEFLCTECDSLLNKENLIEHYKSHISEVSAKVIEDVKRCHGGSVEKDVSPSNESNESKLLLKSCEGTPHSTLKPKFTVKPGVKKIYRSKRNVQKPKCFFSYNCSLCDKDISNKLDFLLHFTTKHFPREIRERFPYQAGVRCEPCIEKRQKLFIPKNALHHVKHVGVIHEQVAEFLTEEDRKAMEKFQSQAVDNPNQANSKKLTQKSKISKMSRLQPTKVLTKRLQVNLTNLNCRGLALGPEKKLVTEKKKRRAVEKPMLAQKSVVGDNSNREKADTVVTSVMSDKAGSSTGERCQNQGSPADGMGGVEDGAVLRVPDPAQPFPAFLRSLCSQAQLVVVGLGMEENQQRSTATLHRLVGERVAGGQVDVTISSTELQQGMAVAETAGGEEELLAGMQSEEEGDLVMDI